jgi:hypothetical protein
LKKSPGFAAPSRAGAAAADGLDLAAVGVALEDAQLRILKRGPS